jgi:hypothetical protein
MEIQDFKLLGIPVLEAQLRLHKINFRKTLKVLNDYRDVNLTFTSQSADKPNELTLIHFLFLNGTLPVEFVIAFEQYNNRLLSEIWQIEAAIEELRTEKQQSDLLALFNK